MSWGVVRVTAPVVAVPEVPLTRTWLAVPVIEVTSLDPAEIKSNFPVNGFNIALMRR